MNLQSIKQLYSLINEDKYKTVIITGAGGLLGKAFVGTLLKKNLNVMAIDNNLSSLKSLSRNHENRNLNFMKVNLLNENEINNAKNKTLKNFGTIDYLINCAALDAKVNKKKLILDKFENFKISRWQKELDLNLKITFLSCKIFEAIWRKKIWWHCESGVRSYCYFTKPENL